MDAEEERSSTRDVVPGIAAIVISVIWMLFWALVAMAASAFGGDTRGWVIVGVALAVGLAVFVLGISLVIGWPRSE